MLTVKVNEWKKSNANHTWWHGWRVFGMKPTGCSNHAVAYSRRPHWTLFAVSMTWCPNCFHLNEMHKQTQQQSDQCRKFQIMYTIATVVWRECSFFSLLGRMKQNKNETINWLIRKLTNSGHDKSIRFKAKIHFTIHIQSTWQFLCVSIRWLFGW